MAYAYQIINKCTQFGSTAFDVVLTDPDGVMPEQRVSKQLAGDPSLDSMNAVAAMEAIAAEQRFTATQGEQAVETQRRSLVPEIIAFLENVNPVVRGAELPVLARFVYENNPRLFEENFPVILEHLTDRYPELVAEFKQQMGIE